MKDNKFTFFESYHRALSRVGDEQYGRIVRAICNYIFDNQEPEFEEDSDWMAWELMKPILDKGRDLSEVRADAGRSGGLNGKGVSRNEGNFNASKSVSKANQKQNKSKSKADKEKDKEKDMDEETEHILFKKNNIKNPTIAEIQAYIMEKGYDVDALYFFDYYESNGWMVGKNPMKDWKAAVRTWARNQKPNHYGNNSATISKEQQEQDYLRRSAEFLANISSDGAEESF